MRPDPPDPSTHLNANSLPVTKRRAASAFMFWARAGPAARKLATKAANRAIIPIPSPNTVPNVFVTKQGVVFAEVGIVAPEWHHSHLVYKDKGTVSRPFLLRCGRVEIRRLQHVPVIAVHSLHV